MKPLPFLRTAADAARRIILRARPRYSVSVQTSRPSRILVVGVYLTDKRNTAPLMIREFASSRYHEVVQRWAAIGHRPTPSVLDSVTAFKSSQKVPRSLMLNRLLALERLETFDYVIICDDDIVVGPGFLDAYLAIQASNHLALAQPARTLNSWIDHQITRQVPRALFRRTWFVEIGPMVSLHHSLFAHLLPLDVASPMGWGLDFVWPVVVENQGLSMGIIDATPVDHSLRQPKLGYSNVEALQAMKLLLSTRAHKPMDAAQIVLETVSMREPRP